MREKHVVEDLIRRLESEDLAGYGLWPLPCHVDDEISGIIDLFLASEPAEREVIYGKVKKPFLFLAFSERMAILGVRENSEYRLFEGLIAHVIEDFRYDARENLLRLSLLYHSTSKIGLDPVDLFERAATFATPKAAEYIIEYTHNSWAIHSMGYKEVMTPDGFSYERTW